MPWPRSSAPAVWHGINETSMRCTGLPAEGYYTLSRKAYATITCPEIFRKLKRDIDLPATVVEDAFLEANPKLLQNQITITCKRHKIQGVRICLTQDLVPRKCGFEVSRDCAGAVATPCLFD